jgi:hypothetical protein
MQSVLITPDLVAVKENNIIINKNNNDKKKKKKKVHFSPTLDWSVEDTKIHRRKHWKKHCRIKNKKSSTTTGKRTLCTSHVVIVRNPASSSRRNDNDVPPTFCPPRYKVSYTMLADGSRGFIQDLLAATNNNKDVLRDLCDACLSITCNTDIEYVNLEEHLQEMKTAYKICPKQNFHHDQIFLLEHVYFGFALHFKRDVQEAMKKLYKQELAAKTDDANGSVDDKSTGSGNTESSNSVSIGSALDEGTQKGFHYFRFPRGVARCDGEDNVYGNGPIIYNKPILAEPIGTPADAITPASVYHQNCFAHISAKDIPDPEERRAQFNKYFVVEVNKERVSNANELSDDMHKEFQNKRPRLNSENDRSNDN